jgi:hypothetical protein
MAIMSTVMNRVLLGVKGGACDYPFLHGNAFFRDHGKTVLQDDSYEYEKHDAGQETPVVESLDIFVVNSSGLGFRVPLEEITLHPLDFGLSIVHQVPVGPEACSEEGALLEEPPGGLEILLSSEDEGRRVGHIAEAHHGVKPARSQSPEHSDERHQGDAEDGNPPRLGTHVRRDGEVMNPHHGIDKAGHSCGYPDPCGPGS